MIRDLLLESADLRDTGSPVADVCIVGAGAAGICLALELERTGHTVVVLEGGGAQLEEPAQEPYRSEVVGHEHRGIHAGRVRAQGGTTTKWGGQILELNAEDFERRSWVPESGWPFGKEELRPFYARALELEGVSGAMQDDAEVWRALRLPPPKFPQLEPYFSRWCPQPNFAVLHGKQLNESERITVWLHANAVALELADGALRGVVAATQVGKRRVFRARQYVFCMGAIECVRLFLQPRPEGLPWNRSGLLGLHFQDHVDANVARLRVRDPRAFAAAFENVFLRGYKYHPKLRLAPAVQAERATLNCAASVVPAIEGPDTQGQVKAAARSLLRGKFGEMAPGDLLRLGVQAPSLSRAAARLLLQKRVAFPAGVEFDLRAHCEQPPGGDSHLTLSGERDSLGLLRTRLDWRVGAMELHSAAVLAECAQRSLSHVAEVTIDAALAARDAAFVERCDDSNHHMGGMRMGTPETSGVVDTDLRLTGVRNCFVCSGAVFPASGFSNPTHTVLALAMRLAAHLHELCAAG